MIWQPKAGQRVQLRYRKSLRDETGIHCKVGIIKKVGSGNKPKNCLVHLEYMEVPGNKPKIRTAHFPWTVMRVKNVVVPRGNLFAI